MHTIGLNMQVAHLGAKLLRDRMHGHGLAGARRPVQQQAPGPADPQGSALVCVKDRPSCGAVMPRQSRMLKWHFYASRSSARTHR